MYKRQVIGEVLERIASAPPVNTSACRYSRWSWHRACWRATGTWRCAYAPGMSEGRPKELSTERGTVRFVAGRALTTSKNRVGPRPFERALGPENVRVRVGFHTLADRGGRTIKPCPLSDNEVENLVQSVGRAEFRWSCILEGSATRDERRYSGPLHFLRGHSAEPWVSTHMPTPRDLK